MIGEDLVGNDVAGDQSGQDSRTDDRASWRRARIELVAARAHDRYERRGRILPARLAEISREEPDELFEVAHQCGVPVHLHTEVLEHGNARGRGDAACRGAYERLLD